MVASPHDGPQRASPPGVCAFVLSPPTLHPGRPVWPREYCGGDSRACKSVSQKTPWPLPCSLLAAMLWGHSSSPDRGTEALSQYASTSLLVMGGRHLGSRFSSPRRAFRRLQPRWLAPSWYPHEGSRSQNQPVTPLPNS